MDTIQADLNTRSPRTFNQERTFALIQPEPQSIGAGGAEQVAFAEPRFNRSAPFLEGPRAVNGVRTTKIGEDILVRAVPSQQSFSQLT